MFDISTHFFVCEAVVVHSVPSWWRQCVGHLINVSSQSDAALVTLHSCGAAWELFAIVCSLYVNE